jgi:ubiquitin-like protein Pup
MTAEEQKRAKRKPAAQAETDAPAATEKANTEEVDKLIGEIDEILEENAEEFVRSYVQKGGE